MLLHTLLHCFPLSLREAEHRVVIVIWVPPLKSPPLVWVLGKLDLELLPLDFRIFEPDVVHCSVTRFGDLLDKRDLKREEISDGIGS